MKRLVAIAPSYRKGGAIVREVGDHAFVVLRIPGSGPEQRIEFGVRELAESFKTDRVGCHDCDGNRRTGWTRASFEEKP
jgi:hypothetical protein